MLFKVRGVTMDERSIAIRRRHQATIEGLLKDNPAITVLRIANVLNIGYETARRQLAIAKDKMDLIVDVSRKETTN